jgi:hypothetical protein
LDILGTCGVIRFLGIYTSAKHIAIYTQKQPFNILFCLSSSLVDGGLACILSGYLSDLMQNELHLYPYYCLVGAVYFPFLFAVQSTMLFIAFLLFGEWSLL